MDLFIICRKNGRAEISKEYKNKTKEEAREIIKHYLASYDGYICTCKTREEAIKTIEGLNGN